MDAGDDPAKRHDSRRESLFLRATARNDERPAVERKKAAPQRQTRKTRQSSRS